MKNKTCSEFIELDVQGVIENSKLVKLTDENGEAVFTVIGEGKGTGVIKVVFKEDMEKFRREITVNVVGTAKTPLRQ